MFAEKYIHKNCNYPALIKDTPHKKTGIVIVIPCLDEPGILLTLESLNQCIQPVSYVEVIVVVNESEAASQQVKEANQETIKKIEGWKKVNEHTFMKFYPVYPGSFPKKWAGAGLARKTGMDEAIRRFNYLANPNGIILSLDADTLVEKNYLQEVEKHFTVNPGHVAATIQFEHQKNKLSGKQKEGIELYEQYMKYYKEAVAFTGFPYSMFTIGSAFAVQAGAYVKQGGMNKHQAGEDFYFLHKLTSLGEIGEVSSTCVHPSARISNRVPFGTGPILQKWLDGEEDLKLTYNFQAFIDLKKLLDRIESLYRISEKGYNRLLKVLPLPLKEFLLQDNFFSQLAELNANCSSVKVFQKRFFQLFNAFKILKFINYVHEGFYKKGNLLDQIELLKSA